MTNHPRRRVNVESPELLALLESARRSDGPSAPKQHHLVPASYLRRWAENKSIQVTDLDDDCRTFLSSPKNIAKEKDYYRVEAEEVDPEIVPPLLYETMLSGIENWGKQAIDELLVHQPWEIDNPELMAYFVAYLAFQYTRGQGHRQMQRDMTANLFRITHGDMTDQQIVARLKKSGRPTTEEAVEEIRQIINQLRDGSLVVQPPDAMAIGHAGQSAQEIGKHFLTREWIVYQTPPILVTCDEPVVTIGGPGLPRTEQAGVQKAGIIIFPLSPRAVLVMFRRDIAPDPMAVKAELNRIEIAELNREIISNATRWVFDRPGRKTGVAMKVPPRPSPTKFEEFQTSDADSIIRSFRPSRWANSDDPPPWPVEHWWA